MSVLITGSSAGVGLSLAGLILERSREAVILTSRDPAKLAAARESLGSERVECIPCDHARKASVDSLIERLLALPEPPLRIVANVGFNPLHEHGPMRSQSLPYELLMETLTTNVANTFWLVSRLLPAMRKARFGRVVLIGSLSYKAGVPGQAAYNVSKAALVGMKNTWVSEYGSSGIGVHLLNPGLIENQRTLNIRRRLENKELPFRLVPPRDVAEAAHGLLALDPSERNGVEMDLE